MAPYPSTPAGTDSSAAFSTTSGEGRGQVPVADLVAGARRVGRTPRGGRGRIAELRVVVSTRGFAGRNRLVVRLSHTAHGSTGAVRGACALEGRGLVSATRRRASRTGDAGERPRATRPGHTTDLAQGDFAGSGSTREPAIGRNGAIHLRTAVAPCRRAVGHARAPAVVRSVRSEQIPWGAPTAGNEDHRSHRREHEKTWAHTDGCRGWGPIRQSVGTKFEGRRRSSVVPSAQFAGHAKARNSRQHGFSAES